VSDLRHTIAVALDGSARAEAALPHAIGLASRLGARLHLVRAVYERTLPGQDVGRQREEACRDPWIVFPGALQGRHIRETGAKGATLVTVREREIAEVEHRDLDVFRWALCPVDVAGAVDSGEVLDRIGKALEREVAAADGRSLAVRLIVEGACPAHGELTASPERWAYECRALGRGSLWIEKVQLRTRPSDAVRTADDALGGLLRSIEDLQSGGGLAELAEGFVELRRKLPPELFEDAETLDPTDPERLRGLLGEVEDLLLARLLTSPEAP